MRVLVHITARAGSKGVPGKNLRTVGGISLVGAAVRVGLAFLGRRGLQGDVFVDTDGEAIADEGRRWGADVPFLRSKELAGDGVNSADTVLGALDRLQEGGRTYDVLVLLQPTSPLRRVEDVCACFDAHLRTGSALTIARLEHPIERALTLDRESRLAPVFSADSVAAPRQLHGSRVSPTGAVYVIAIDQLRKERKFLVPGVTVGVSMPEDRSVDIDREEELASAEAQLDRCWSATRPPARALVAPSELRSWVDSGETWSRAAEIGERAPDAKVLLSHPFDICRIGCAVALDDSLSDRVHLLASIDRASWHETRRLAIGLDVGLAVSLDGFHAELLGAAIALGASVITVPQERLELTRSQIASVLSLTRGQRPGER